MVRIIVAVLTLLFSLSVLSPSIGASGSSTECNPATATGCDEQGGKLDPDG